MFNRKCSKQTPGLSLPNSGPGGGDFRPVQELSHSRSCSLGLERFYLQQQCMQGFAIFRKIKVASSNCPTNERSSHLLMVLDKAVYPHSRINFSCSYVVQHLQCSFLHNAWYLMLHGSCSYFPPELKRQSTPGSFLCFPYPDGYGAPYPFIAFCCIDLIKTLCFFTFISD